VVVVPFPAGNANVFARALGWPSSATAALGRIGPALALGRHRTLMLGRLRAGPLERVFCVNAGVGLDAETVRSVEAHPRRKRALRHAAYAMAAGAAAARLARRPTPIVIRADDGPAVTVVSLVAACGAPYAWAGPRALDVLPGADFGGGIEWMGLVSAGPVGLAVAARGVLTRGAAPHALLPRGRVSRALEADAEGPVAVQADGEALGRYERVVISPGPALVVLVP
jgi:diacylglycerol kinase family enzyme